MDHPFSPTKHVEDPPPLIRRVDAFEVIECRTRTLDQTPKRKANPKIAMLPVVPANGGEPPEALPPMCPSDRCFGVSLSLSLADRQDLSKFDIVPEKIRKNEDPRTTAGGPTATTPTTLSG